MSREKAHLSPPLLGLLAAVALLATGCLLVGVGFALAFAETPEPSRTVGIASGWKFVVWVLAALAFLGSIPLGRVVTRRTRRHFEK